MIIFQHTSHGSATFAASRHTPWLCPTPWCVSPSNKPSLPACRFCIPSCRSLSTNRPASFKAGRQVYHAINLLSLLFPVNKPKVNIKVDLVSLGYYISSRARHMLLAKTYGFLAKTMPLPVTNTYNFEDFPVLRSNYLPGGVQI